MTSITGSEDRPAYDVLARKTVEILDVVNSTRQLLIEQYNNDQTMWLEAMFRILMWKNQAFVLDERNSSARDPNVHKFLRDLILEMFRSMNEKSSPASDAILRNQLLETGCNLISTFRVFTNFLVQSKLDISEELTNLQHITKNIEKYVQNLGNKSEKAKLADQEQIKSVVSEPEKILENEPPRIETVANETDTTPTNESPNAKLVASEPQNVKTVSNEHHKLRSASESPKLKPAASGNAKVGSAVPFDSPKMKPATSKRNLNEETFGSEATELAWKDSVLGGVRRSATPVKVGATDDHLCEICNDPITVFNYDREFSLVLHESDPKHMKAVKKMKAAAKCAETEEKSSLASSEDIETRKAIVELVGEAQARFFKINVGDEFFCTLCQCPVYSTHNVVSHVQGGRHRRNCGLNSQESKESKSGSDSRDLTSDEVDSAEDEDVLRVGSTLPVKTLFD